jgi:hypothetical protein
MPAIAESARGVLTTCPFKRRLYLSKLRIISIGGPSVPCLTRGIRSSYNYDVSGYKGKPFLVGKNPPVPVSSQFFPIKNWQGRGHGDSKAMEIPRVLHLNFIHFKSAIILPIIVILYGVWVT